MLIWLLVVAGVVILDQGSKLLVWYAMGLDEVGESITLIPNFLNFTHVKNTGAAFGMFGEENQRWIFMVVSALGICALLVYLWKFRPESKLACTALSMVVGGGIGNMIDRSFRVGIIDGKERNYVFDFIDFRGFGDLWKWTFNVADAFVCVGAGLLMVWCVYAFIKELKAERLKKKQGDIIAEQEVSSAEDVAAVEIVESQETAEEIIENGESEESVQLEENETAEETEEK